MKRLSKALSEYTSNTDRVCTKQGRTLGDSYCFSEFFLVEIVKAAFAIIFNCKVNRIAGNHSETNRAATEHR